jgi:hypothetical protein
MCVDGDLIIRSGEIYAEGGQLEDIKYTANSAGIVCQGDVTIAGGKVTGIGGIAKAQNGSSVGIQVGRLSMTGGSLIAKGQEASRHSAGICIDDREDSVLSGGTLYAEGGDVIEAEIGEGGGFLPIPKEDDPEEAAFRKLRESTGIEGVDGLLVIKKTMGDVTLKGKESATCALIINEKTGKSYSNFEGTVGESTIKVSPYSVEEALKLFEDSAGRDKLIAYFKPWMDYKCVKFEAGNNSGNGGSGGGYSGGGSSGGGSSTSGDSSGSEGGTTNEPGQEEQNTNIEEEQTPLDETPVTEFSISNKQMKATYVIGNGSVALKKLTAKATKVTIPNTVKAPTGKKYKVTEILAEALKGNKSLKTVVIPKNVKVLNKNIFKGCKKLKTIEIAGVVKTVKKGAFAGIKNVTVRINNVTKKEFNKMKKAIEKSGIGKTVTVVKGN